MSEKSKSSSDIGTIFSALLIGLINGVLCIPVTISFCSIIFRDNVFEDQMPKLVKLVLFSSAVHQICFSTFSSLPFAVGQVQDAGLIFLSAIATSVVVGCSHGENIIPTTLFVLGICTALLGIMLLVVAKLKLASVIQYLPMPVIGGYLAYIGFFCGKAGLAMMGGITDPDFRDFSPKAFILMAPGLLIGLTMYMLLRNVRSPFVLPISMGVILVAFYSLLWFWGGSFEDARDYGWIAPYSPLEPFYRSWMLYDVTRVEWSLLSDQWLRLICMFLVVAFSSSLDVAAIEMEVGLPLNYNTELFTVGLSNVVSGLAGGYTGSYIFSQTIFNLRRKVNTRLCGFTVAVLELVVVVMPVSVTSFVPKLFFGSLLILISVDLMFEWLVSVRVKMTTFEYCVCLATFVAIIFTNIEIGMMMGILLATFSFVVTYARLQTVSVASLLSSTVVRTFEDRAVLIANRGKIVTISLKGYIFFGSAVTILEEVKRHVIVQTVNASGSKESESLSSSTIGINGQSLLEPVAGVGAGNAAELKPLLSEGMKSLNSYQSGQERGKLSPKDIEEFNHSAMMPRYSFSLNVNNPQVFKHPMMVMKRSHSLFTERPHPDSLAGLSGGGSLTGSTGAGSIGGGAATTVGGGAAGGSYQSGSLQVGSGSGGVNAFMGSAGASTAPVPGSVPNSGVIGSLLFKVGKQNSGSNVGSFSDAPLFYGSDESANNSAHGPAGKKKKRTVSFDQHGKPTADIEMGLLAIALANAKDAQGVSLTDTTAPLASSGPITAPPVTHNDNPLVIREPTIPEESPAKKKSMSLFATIWQNQQKKREKVKESVGTPRKEFNSLTPKDRFSPKYSPPDPSVKPAASALKAVSAFPDVNFDNDSLGDNISTEYLILDFSRVLGVDATAARSCFMMLVQLMRASQVIVVFAHMSKEIEIMLRNQRVIIDTDIVIPHLDDALEWCEDRVLNSFKDANKTNKQDDIQKSASSYSKAHQDRQNQETIKPSTSYGDLRDLLSQSSGSKENSRRGSFDETKGTKGTATPPITFYGIPQPKSAAPLRKILIDYLETEMGINPQVDVLLNSETLLKYFKFINFNERELIFDVDDWADALFFIEKGMVEIVSLNQNQNSSTMFTTVKKNGKLTVNTPNVQRVNKVSAGGAFGEADFFLGRKHSVRAYTMTNCHCWILDRESYANMELQHPNLCLLIQHTLLKSLAISSTCSMYSLTNTGGDKDEEEAGGAN